MSELDELRQRVETLDSAILGAISARLDAVRRIGELKKAAGVPLRDWRREREVIRRAEETAQALGISKPLARDVMRAVIQESCTIQERQSYSVYGGESERIVVIGGAGKMGRWLVDFFENQGHLVDICDPAAENTADATGVADCPALRNAQIAVIATPLSAAPDVVEQLAAVAFPGVACDIASLKSHLAPTIREARAAGLRYTSVHPMFGPNTRTLSDQVICICDCGDSEATQRVRRFFADTAATLVDLTLDEHDRIVSHVLGLSHLLNLVFASALAGSGFAYDRLNQVGSTTFRSQMQTTAAVVHENPELYYEIQTLNRFTPEVNQRLTEHLRRWTDWISCGDHDAFVQAMRLARDWTDKHDAH
ncbi:MAG: prephenate dehydrogenase/arogenate dehydrogenase family protein [Planctomycetota bacterium]|nr:MAG: prephenate dehydrogenase/arogenate dehydrogenase family protein [Planctomycetota bacterium]